MMLAAGHAIETFGSLALITVVIAWLLVTQPQIRAAAGVAVLILAPIVLLGSVTGDNESSLPQIAAPVVAGLVILGAGVVGATAWFFVCFPRLVVPAALIALPFRVPLAVGGESVKLLLLLYLVIAGAVVAYAWQAHRGGARVSRSPRLIDATLALFLALYALQGAYSPDVSVATQNICFFYAPFALLYGIVATQKWDAELLRWCAGALIGVALVLVAAGFVEYARGEYLIHPGGIKPNDFDPYFRIQSLFFDPNIFGRFVALVMILVAAVLLFTRRSSRVLLSALVLAVLWAGLVLTLSQSSFAALLAGLITLAAIRWDSRKVLTATGLTMLVGVAFALALPSVSKIDLGSSRGAETSTSGRFDLVKGGVTLWSERPLWGHGSGGFSEAFRSGSMAKKSAFGSPSTSKSHTAPLTVAAEQGLIGLAAFLALLYAAFAAVFRRVGDGASDVDRPLTVARVAVAAAFTALFVHSLAYAALLEDPLTWVLIGAAISLAATKHSRASTAESDAA